MNEQQKERGVYRKFRVERTDGKSAPGQKHFGCEYFVLDTIHDPHAKPALLAYAASCESKYPELAEDARRMASGERVLAQQETPSPSCLSERFASEFYARHDHKYSGIEIWEWLRRQETPSPEPVSDHIQAGIAAYHKAHDGEPA